MAAAEGTVAFEPARLGPRFGLTSVLLLRERRPRCCCEDDDGWRWGARAGDVSRDECGDREFAVEGEPDTFFAREPFRACWRMVEERVVVPLSDAVVVAAGRFSAAEVDDVGVMVLAEIARKELAWFVACGSAQSQCWLERVRPWVGGVVGEPVRRAEQLTDLDEITATRRSTVECWHAQSCGARGRLLLGRAENFRRILR